METLATRVVVVDVVVAFIIWLLFSNSVLTVCAMKGLNSITILSVKELTFHWRLEDLEKSRCLHL